MKRIYKYQIGTVPIQDIIMPEGAEILCVQVQNGQPCVWALIDPVSTKEDNRELHIFGTGHEMDNTPRKYIGTYQERGGILVWHLFERL